MKRITELEYELTAKLIEVLGLDTDSENLINLDGMYLKIDNKNLGFSDFYNTIWTIKPNILFTPMSNEKHSDMLIRVFSYIHSELDVDYYEVKSNSDGTYRGSIVNNKRKEIKGTVVNNISSQYIAKCLSIMKYELGKDSDEFKDFKRQAKFLSKISKKKKEYKDK